MTWAEYVARFLLNEVPRRVETFDCERVAGILWARLLGADARVWRPALEREFR